MKISEMEIQSIVRTDLVAFAEGSFYELNPGAKFLHNFHIDVLAEALEQCRAGTLRRLVINLPPRSLKSHMASVVFPAWLLGHDPAAQIIAASYAQPLADKLAGDCLSLMSTRWYRNLFPATRLARPRQAVHDFSTTERGFRLATSVGGVLTGRGADWVILDDPLRPDEALSETQRQGVNNWFDHTVVSRLNDKTSGRIIIIMQRLHEDDLVGHVFEQAGWRVLKFAAVAEEDEAYLIQTPYGSKKFTRRQGEALHPKRESLKVLAEIRQIQGEYNFSGQYQQAPAPLGGGMVKVNWFKTYTETDLPPTLDMVFQSWDTSNTANELSDYSVCSTWGVKHEQLFLLHVLRKRLSYPALKRAVREQAEVFKAAVILIEDRASGTQLIQELVNEGMHSVQRYVPNMDKVMRLHAVTGMIENGFVHVPEKVEWLAEYLHELITFPRSKFDDQADSTSQALDWFRSSGNISLPPAMSCFCVPRPWDGQLPRAGQTFDVHGWPSGGPTCEKFPQCWDSHCECFEC